MRINLTKKEIISSLYMQLGFSKKVCENLLEDFFDILLDELIKHKNVKIAKFGTFKRKITPKRIGRNPKTGQEYIIKQRERIRFYPSPKIKKFFN